MFTCHVHIHVHVAQLMRPGIGRNASCAVGDCLTSRPKGRSQPRELWFLIYSCTWALGVAVLYMYLQYFTPQRCSSSD